MSLENTGFARKTQMLLDNVSFALKKYILCKIREKSYVSVTHKLNLRDTFRIPEMQYKVRTKYNVRAYFNSKCCSSAGLQVVRC